MISLAMICSKTKISDNDALNIPPHLWIISNDYNHIDEALKNILPLPHEERLELAFAACMKYMDWERRMMLCINEQQSLQNLVDEASRMLKNPIVILDDNQMVLARSQNAPKDETGTIWDAMWGDYFALGDYYTQNDMHDFMTKISESPDGIAVYHSERDPKHTFYAATIRSNKSPVASIGGVDIYGPYDSAELDTLEVVRNYLEMSLKSPYMRHPYASLSSPVLSRLLAGADVDNMDMDKELNSCGTDASDECSLLSVQCPVPLDNELVERSYLNLMRTRFPHSLCTVFQDSLFVALSRRDNPIANPQKNDGEKEFKRFLEQNDLQGGLSYPISSFAKIGNLLAQSLYSLHLAIEEDSRLTCYRDVEISHLSSVLKSSQNLEAYCLPELLTLWNSGRESDRELIRCLKAFLTNGRSIAATSRALELHRNTIVYRVEKLADVFGCDVRDLDEDTAMLAILTVRILENS